MAQSSGKKKYTSHPTWGYSGSVLIEGDLAILSPGKKSGGLLALNKKNGEEIWKAPSSGSPAGYATPYPFTLNKKRYVVGFLGKRVIIVEAKTGREVWSLPWNTSYDVNAASPIFFDGHLFLTSGYQHGSSLFRMEAISEGKLKGHKIWENKAILNKFQSPVLHQGHLYTSDQKGMRCLDFYKGKQLWKIKGQRHGTLLIANDHIIFLSEKGELQFAKVSPIEYKPIYKKSFFKSRCWTVPVLHNGKLYIRDLKTVKCINLNPSSS